MLFKLLGASDGHSIVRQSFITSADITASPEVLLMRSLMYRKKTGTNTEPCMTAIVTSMESECHLLTTAPSVLLIKNLSIQP